MIGKMDEEKKQYEYDIDSFRVLRVNDWYLINPIDRGVSLRFFSRKGYLSLFDYIF